MSKKMDKDMLKNPDAFITASDKVFNFVERHFKLAAAVIGTVVVASVVYVTVGYFNAAKEQKASEALYLPEAELKKAEAQVRDERAKKTQALIGDKKKDAKAESTAPVDFAKVYAPSVEKIKAALKANGHTKAGLISALNLSYFLSQQKQFAQALEVLEIPTYRPSSSDLLGGFWLMHRGAQLIENGKVDEAISNYQSVLAEQNMKLFFPEALLKLGLAYELKGDGAKARETYEKVGREFPETEASNTAQQYIRLLELNSVKKG